MKYILITILLCIGISIQAQQVVTKKQFNGIYTIGAAIEYQPGVFDLFGTFNNKNGNYQNTDIAVGDVVWDAGCNIYVVDSILQTTPYLGLRCSDVNGTAATTGEGLIYRPTVNFKFPLPSVDVPKKIENCVEMHTVIEIDRILADSVGSGGGGGITIYGKYKNHTDAGTNGVPVGEIYKAGDDNTMGKSPGSLIIRQF